MDLDTSQLHPAKTILLVLGVFFTINWLRLLVFDPLRKIPGPIIARFTKLWLLRKYSRGDFQRTNVELHRKYGPVVRIAPTEYSLDDLHAAKVIYGHGSQFHKGDWYATWGHPDITNIFNERNPKQHSEDRRRVASAYSMTSMVSYEPYVNDCTEILSQRFDEFAIAGLPVDIGYWLQCYAFDTIGLVTFGTRFGFLDAGEDINRLIQSLEIGAKTSTIFGVYPAIYPAFFRFITSMMKLGKKNWGLGFLTTFVVGQISYFKKKPSVPQDPEPFIVKFLRLQKEKPQSMTDRAIHLGVTSNVAAGSDTTSITLSAIVYHLYRNPSVLAKLRAEIDEHARSGLISDPITFREAQSLPYLQAVIKEGLRIHPATGLPMPRAVPGGGAMVAGQWFPEGTTVGINSWVAHHNKEIYGQDAESFRPERWLEENKDMDAYFFAFGQGSRTCLGKNVSLLEASKAIPQLVRHFDIAVDEEWRCRNYWFVKPVDFRCLVTKRKV